MSYPFWEPDRDYPRWDYFTGDYNAKQNIYTFDLHDIPRLVEMLLESGWEISPLYDEVVRRRKTKIKRSR